MCQFVFTQVCNWSKTLIAHVTFIRLFTRMCVSCELLLQSNSWTRCHKLSQTSGFSRMCVWMCARCFPLSLNVFHKTHGNVWKELWVTLRWSSKPALVRYTHLIVFASVFWEWVVEIHFLSILVWNVFEHVWHLKYLTLLCRMTCFWKWVFRVNHFPHLSQMCFSLLRVPCSTITWLFKLVRDV